MDAFDLPARKWQPDFNATGTLGGTPASAC